MSERNRRPTQAARLLDYLREHRAITQREAINELGCYRLGARIWELKHDGHPIKREMITVKDRWGEETRIASYSLAE